MHDWKHNKIRECVSDGKEETMVGQVLNQGFLWDVGQRLRKVASASKLMVGFPKLDLRINRLNREVSSKLQTE